MGININSSVPAALCCSYCAVFYVYICVCGVIRIAEFAGLDNAGLENDGLQV